MTQTVICIASGPSLTAEDCQLATRSAHPVIAVNSSWAAAPGCQHIYAADFSWWQYHHLNLTTCAQRWTSSVNAALQYGLNYFPHPDTGSFNSGLRAIQLAVHLGATRILLLGYDGSLDSGLHWHGEHPQGLKNPDAESVLRWASEFRLVADLLPPGTEVINCSGKTELSCFPVSSLRTVLCT